MSNVLENTPIGRRLREAGREAGREEGLLVMLQERFGEVPGLEKIAERLAATGDFRAALGRIRSATSLEELRA